MRGNVVDLAVAVIIGAAFGAVVNAFPGRLHREADAETPAPSDEARLLTEIRDLMAAQPRA
jgi:large-conductance mechanosensitive channel